jgi:ribosome biogenesis GTPase
MMTPARDILTASSCGYGCGCGCDDIGESSNAANSDAAPAVRTGVVVCLDRGYPLVRLTTPDNSSPALEVRAQHAIDLVKNAEVRAAVGDIVELELPPGQDTPLITRIQPRGPTLVRRSLVESQHEGAGKHIEQVLAANIDIVLVVMALSSRPPDLDYLERQLVLAHDSGAEAAVVLTKADQCRHPDRDLAAIAGCAGGDPVIACSAVSGEGLEQIRALTGADRKAAATAASKHQQTTAAGAASYRPLVAVLLGRSGVGKSTLVNELLGTPLLEVGEVRKKDKAGRHTTVARRMVFLSDGSALIDTPGLRSIGLFDAQLGLERAFPEISTLAAECRYRDCAHTSEPGCAVIAAVEAGHIPLRRLQSYRQIATEVAG